jgi:hypothetical protein
LTTSETEKETADRTGAGNVEAPAPIARERELRMMMMHSDRPETYKSALKEGAVVAVGEMSPQRERKKTNEPREGRQDQLQMLQAQPSKGKKADIPLGRVRDEQP